MKKRTRIALIVAAALILFGGILLAVGLSFAEDSTLDSKLIRKEITIQESFDTIAIDTEDCDVKFAMLSGQDDCMVEIRAYKNVKHTAAVEDGTLKIKMIDKRRWIDYVGVFGMSEQMEMTVYLPVAEYNALQVRTASGDITLGQQPVFLETQLRTNTGDISCVTGVGGDLLDCMTSTGDICIQNSTAKQIKLQSDTGDFQMSVVAGDEIQLKTDTGDVEAQNVNAQMFTCQTDTGDVELEQVQAAEYLKIFTNTGDVGVKDCDAGTVNIETDTGDVSGNFLTPKWFQADSNTGDVQVPHSRDGGECRIQSDNGDIKIR